jgi:threonine/homoserine/homoserine lactone efflux protein
MTELPTHWLALPFSPDALLAYATYFVATASPGPSNLSIMGIAMNEGRRAALQFAAGVLCGSLFWAILAVCGLSALLAGTATLLWALKIAGGLYLLWLAWRSLRSALRPDAQPLAAGPIMRSPEPAWQLYLRGLGMHLTNPKAVLAWLAIVSLALPVGAQTGQALWVVGGCMLIGALVFGGYAMLFSVARARRIYARSRRGLEGVLAVVFATAGMRLLAGSGQ